MSDHQRDIHELGLMPANDVLHFAGSTAMLGLRMEQAGDVAWLHNVGESYPDIRLVPGIDRYSGRVVCATLAGDTVHLAEGLRDDHAVIREHYRELGLETAENVVWDMRYPSGESMPTSVFLFGDEAHTAQPDARRRHAVEFWNDKNVFIRYAQQHGHPVPRTDTYTVGEIPKRSFDGPWYVKGAVAASGTLVFRCETWEDVARTAESIGVDFQIQEDVRADTFLNVQYNAHAGQAHFVATTEQVLHGFSHAGNRHPSRHDPRTVTDALAAEVAASGVEGIFAFDVAVTRDSSVKSEAHSGRARDGGFLIIECNPRPNGSTYYTALAERLRVHEWSAINIPTARSLRDSVRVLSAAGLVYDANRQTGLAIVNWGTASDSKLGILFVGPPNVQEQYETHARTLLAI